ncbi:MAG: bifunctional oligoribonuclease/PAP phosphatase NrnA [Gemmatimonadetes bacterium]|nr:bifunctional oligoribonuclease/PAP phosphatase NrnA [Gemmatimonadota bacterium]MCY3678867.1 bifunctional oligoribonuclease/PAP phosphatase NrnA [Gemmatimonadota bacterium]MYA40389.1 bifunctional oligoribonuclease/PAP phosphatase NrnA [Gemmatimonadota bacterium]MYE95229.1 bifunctional oligoribonuclease/PAP phosphatase NrnA [Gemmatimonadota bacterium]MYJ09062.1 bifunctional oligoribonuclease/PAP phosphatase NrnA [Gemmatimonadota bacterium]
MTEPRGGRARTDRGSRFDEVLERLDRASSVVITTHANADGDGAGSQVALAAFLRERGAEAWLVNPTPFPESFGFLLPDPGWVLPPKSGLEARHCSEADLAVVLDTARFPRIGRVKSLIRHLPKVVIDHHPPSDRPIDGLVICDTAACATGALVFELIDRAGGPWPPSVARALYVAVMTDTGGFRFSNTDRDCFRVASRLVELGAVPEALFRAVYGRFRVRRFELLREALATLTVHADGRIAWMTVPKDAYDRVGATVEDLEGFVDVPRDVDGVQVAMLFRTTADGRIKVSLRSVPPIDVGAVATGFGGGGHARAAAAVVTGPLGEVIARVLRRVERLVDEQGPAGGVSIL